MAGSVFRRGGVYYIRYELPPDASGKRKQKMQACPGLDEKQAKDKLALIKADIIRGSYLDASTLTVAEFMNEWLQFRADRIEATTLDGYKGLNRRYVQPNIGHLMLDKLKPLHLQKLYKDLLANDKADVAPLSAKTVRNLHGMLHTAFGQGLKWQMLLKNPVDMVDPPKVIRKNINVADRAEMVVLLDAINDSPWRIPILIAMSTGMRRGEICGLKWEDVLWESNVLLVRRSILQIPGKVAVKGTKTDKPRHILIPESLLEDLRDHQAQQVANAAKQPGGIIDEGWICTHPDGRLITPHSLSGAFRSLSEKVNLPITLHGLRHTQATELIMAGVPVKVVAERLGHANVNITQNIYAHVIPSMQQKAVDVMEEVLGRSKPNIRIVEA